MGKAVASLPLPESATEAAKQADFQLAGERGADQDETDPAADHDCVDFWPAKDKHFLKWLFGLTDCLFLL